MGLIYYYDSYFKFFFTMVDVNVGHPVAQLVEALRSKPEGCGFDLRWSLEFFIDIVLPVALWPWC